jgi:hypothetical protein
VWLRPSSTGLMQDRLDLDLPTAAAGGLGEMLQLAAKESMDSAPGRDQTRLDSAG